MKGVSTMHSAIRLLKNLGRREEAVTALEYALIAALVAVAIVTAATTLGADIASVFTTIAGKLVAT
jgi:pilus assembly protein Flp/PilA